MKATTALVVAATVASASAFAPMETGRPSTQLSEKKSIFGTIADMDLWKDRKDSNEYGARAKKNLSQGKIGANSYVPNGLSAAEYQKIRDGEASKKAANYQKNVAKAGKFLDYTDFYTKRGTDTNEGWFKSVTRGHDMAKTKYDWSGQTGDLQKNYDGSTKNKKR